MYGQGDYILPNVIPSRINAIPGERREVIHTTSNLSPSTKKSPSCIDKSTCIKELIDRSINRFVQGSKKDAKTYIHNPTIGIRNKGNLGKVLKWANTNYLAGIISSYIFLPVKTIDKTNR